ncbi:MAG: hypothetical protein E7650_02635 [Ruminococcaceae bacterium]|nr:hypothetical protein [Oscillospiraceae bacterium]
MKKGEIVVFVIAMILAAGAIVVGAFSVYFGVAVQIEEVAHGADPNMGSAIGLGFLLVFLVIAFMISVPCTVISLVLLLLAPVKAALTSVRRASRVLVVVLAVLLVLQVVLFLMALL